MGAAIPSARGLCPVHSATISQRQARAKAACRINLRSLQLVGMMFRLRVAYAGLRCQSQAIDASRRSL